MSNEEGRTMNTITLKELALAIYHLIEENNNVDS